MLQVLALLICTYMHMHAHAQRPTVLMGNHVY